MAEDTQANFEAAINNLLKNEQEVVGAPPIMEEKGIGLSSLIGGSKKKAGDVIQRIRETFDPGIPEEAFPATTRRELERKNVLPDIQIPPEKPTPPTGEQRVFNRLLIKKLNPAAIAGIMGNIDVETAGSFDFTQKQEKGPGYGLFQFEKGHQEEYQNYLKNNNKVDSPEAQVDYVMDNIYLGTGHDIGNKNRLELQNIFKSGSPEEIALQFSRIFERPQQGKEHNDRRMQSATQRFESISGNRRGGMISRNPYPHNPRPI
ncbi:MAG: hypothetical protein CMN56_13860 [Sneathiella sp.]|uniref:phage tail tip lysozyme n=1 Tax=Sneathiella sp. TaxID=1964365 RepID=UPI000C61276A|nr:phage tail tip lysozyme [Sneathiella sp.]MAZ04213.1 hypothetical protein [Sneathiella sp.]